MCIWETRVGKTETRSPVVLALLGGIIGLSLAAGRADAERPNIVLFLVDDMGWQDTSVPLYYEDGVAQTTALNQRYSTPNMERLAAQGMTFTSARAHAICSPTRISLMTGQNPARHRVTYWTKDLNEITGGNSGTVNAPTDWNFNSLQPARASVPNSLSAPTLAQQLQVAGYRTMHVGKAHFGTNHSPGEFPTALGFDDNVAGFGSGGPGSYLGLQNFGNNFGQNTPNYPWGIPDLAAYHGQDVHLTDVLTGEANALIDDAVANGEPFFLHMSHYAVHAPLSRSRHDPYFDNYPHLSGNERLYAALLEGMDNSLGEIMDNLEDHGIAENTIVLFISDNGTENQGVPVSAPLRGRKGSGYEGGIRVPFIASWPEQIAAGAVNHTNVIVEDLYPTILEMAGAEIPADYLSSVDGRDITPLLTAEGEFDPQRPTFFHQPHRHNGAPFSAVVRGDWKLIFWHETESTVLYNLAEDIGESNDLSGASVNTARGLTNLLVQYLTEVDAQLPTFRSDGRTVELPAVVDNVLGDMNGDSLVEIDDWIAFRAALETDIVASSRVEAELQGDLNFDLRVDRLDFLLFKGAYDEANGAGALAAAAAVPETSAVVLFVGLTLALERLRHRL